MGNSEIYQWADEVTFVIARIAYAEHLGQYLRPAVTECRAFRTIPVVGDLVGWYDHSGAWHGDYPKGDRPRMFGAWR